MVADAAYPCGASERRRPRICVEDICDARRGLEWFEESPDTCAANLKPSPSVSYHPFYALWILLNVLTDGKNVHIISSGPGSSSGQRWLSSGLSTTHSRQDYTSRPETGCLQVLIMQSK